MSYGTLCDVHGCRLYATCRIGDGEGHPSCDYHARGADHVEPLTEDEMQFGLVPRQTAEKPRTQYQKPTTAQEIKSSMPHENRQQRRDVQFKRGVWA